MTIISVPRSNTRNGVFLLAVLLFSIFLAPSDLYGQDYQVNPQPPHFVRDSGTTFLVDLSSAKTNADYAAGSSAISVNPNGFLSSGAYQGTVGFSSAQNFDPLRWTVELLLYLPYSESGSPSIALGGYNTTNASLRFLLDGGWGPRFRAETAATGSSLSVAPYSGGNGFSIQASATDQWVYVSFGVDYVNQLSRVIARSTNGDLLNKNINFLGATGVDTSFLSAYPAGQQPAELLRRWGVLATNLSTGVPAQMTLGSSSVQLRAIRISNTYRSELLGIQPQLPQASATTWTPSLLDPSRTETISVTRSLGYPGYNNFTTIAVDEPHLVLVPGSAPVSISLTNVPIGIYSFMVYGSIDPQGRPSLNRVWRPTPMEFRADHQNGKVLNTGRLLLKQSFVPRRMQGFHLQVDEPGNVTLSFKLPATAQETVWLQQLREIDQLEGLPDVAVKVSQNIASGMHSQLSSLSPARMSKDDAIWAALPPLNQHLQVHGQVAQFQNPPVGANPDNWVLKAYNGIPIYNQPQYTFSPVEFLNLTNTTTFSTSSIYSGTPWPGTLSDNGTGIFYTKASYPALATDIYNSRRAELLGSQYLLFLGAITDSRGSSYGLNLGERYFSTGDPEIGHDGAMALVRWAYDWPALEMSLHELRLSTHSPDFEFNTDWSEGEHRNGKMYYRGWSGSNANWLLETYDKLFPYIQGNQTFANAVHRFVPWVNTPQDVIRFLDRRLVFASVRDVGRGLIDGASNVQGNAALVLGPSPTTQTLFDLTKEQGEIYPFQGTYQELYGTALSRSGVYYIASFLTYAFGDAQNTIHKAFLQKKAREAGVSLPMDLSDVARYPKVRSAGDFLLNMWVAGGFPFMVGDASGGPHSGLEANQRLRMAENALKEAFSLFADPRHAWVLKNLLGSTDPAVTAAAQSQRDPVLFAQSRVVPDYGAVIEAGDDQPDIRRKSAMTLRLGIGQGHSHNDYLDLNFFAMGLPVAVDLACRNEGDNWSRPSASWSFLHNHALAHDTQDPNGAGAQSGEPWLRSFAPPLIQASYVDSTGAGRLDRDAILMQVGDTDTYYAFDVQRVSGGAYHTWSFHGAESAGLAVNVPMAAQSVRWTDRTLEGTQFTGVANDALQATWTMTRSGATYPFSFNGGGVIDTLGAEQAALGSLYDGSKAPVNVRATVLGQSGASVLQGSPYSKAYHYAFPFLWVQKPASGSSIFPAVYEWYRGDTSVVQSAQVSSWSPLRAQVTLRNGQVDTYESSDGGGFSAVSRDAQGVRWASFVNVPHASVGGITIDSGPGYQVSVIDINYRTRQLTTSGPLPADSYVIAGNSGRKIYLQLKGSGTSFTWDDDLLIAEGTITSIRTTTTLSLTTNQAMFSGGAGNRKVESVTVTNEDGTWHFRNGQVIKKPSGATLAPSVFTDSNGDGLINAKTYEFGIGDILSRPAESTIRRNPSGAYEVKTNVTVSGAVDARPFGANPVSTWQPIGSSTIPPVPPQGLRIN